MIDYDTYKLMINYITCMIDNDTLTMYMIYLPTINKMKKFLFFC